MQIILFRNRTRRIFNIYSLKYAINFFLCLIRLISYRAEALYLSHLSPTMLSSRSWNIFFHPFHNNKQLLFAMQPITTVHYILKLHALQVPWCITSPGRGRVLLFHYRIVRAKIRRENHGATKIKFDIQHTVDVGPHMDPGNLITTLFLHESDSISGLINSLFCKSIFGVGDFGRMLFPLGVNNGFGLVLFFRSGNNL